MKHIKRMLATALVALGATASVATAAELVIRPAGEATAVSLGLVTFEEGSSQIRCRITLLISFSQGIILKVTNQTLGQVQRVTVGDENGRVERCDLGQRFLILERRGAAANPATVNWPLTYQSILGTLPSNVTGILFTFNEMQFLITTPLFGMTCLREGNVRALLRVTGSNPYTSSLIRFLEGENIPLKAGAALNSGLCPAHGSLAGALSLTPAQEIARF